MNRDEDDRARMSRDESNSRDTLHDDEKRAWLISVYTRAVHRDLQHSLNAALGYVLSQAAVSTDPIVRAAAATYHERLNLMQIFEMPKE